jgi:hypothetical protein
VQHQCSTIEGGILPNGHLSAPFMCRVHVAAFSHEAVVLGITILMHGWRQGSI